MVVKPIGQCPGDSWSRLGAGGTPGDDKLAVLGCISRPVGPPGDPWPVRYVPTADPLMTNSPDSGNIVPGAPARDRVRRGRRAGGGGGGGANRGGGPPPMPTPWPRRAAPAPPHPAQ